MTRKQQIKAILDDTLKVVVEEADINGKHCIGRKIILGKSEASEKIASLPLDVPGDEEIHKMAYNACMKPSMPNGEPEPEHVYYDAYIHGSNDMRSEILKRNGKG